MIIGSFDDMGQPCIDCQLIIPRLNTRTIVRFLVDTGSTITVLHPFDTRRLAVNPAALTAQSVTAGIGGTVDTFSEPAVLLFEDADGVTRYDYRLNIHVARPDAYNDGYPSLLGMDVLSCWYTKCDPTNNLLRFTVRRTM